MTNRKNETPIDPKKWIIREELPFEEKTIEDRTYSKKLIAFLDVLGITNLVKENVDGNEYKAINKIEEIQKIVKTTSRSLMNDGDFYIINISDSFVFVGEPAVLKDLLIILASIQIRIIHECNFLLRGAVTIGDAIITDEGNYLIGPAYLEAFRLQDKNAIYPRIILDNSVLEEIKDTAYFKEYIFVDKDKEHYLNYVNIFRVNEELKMKEVKSRLISDGVFQFIKDKYNEYNNLKKYKIRQKYGWTIQYFKEIGVWGNAKRS